jgi:capsular exopolysaccharide synthesis family protein
VIAAIEEQRFELLEAFRSLRSSILFMGNGAPNPKTIVISSSIPQEGKSTVSLFLAATLARGNARVLLIDADLRRPRLHRTLGRTSGPGLAEVLSRRVPSHDAIVPSGLDNLSLLPAGRADRNPGELALSAAWPELLADVRSRFDYVLVDSPPVLAVDDVASLAPKTDGVLFVVRGSFTSARLARAATDALRQRQIPVLGLVFNRAVSSPYQRDPYQSYREVYRWDQPANGTSGMLAVPSSGR